jgi:hypothetical protein
MGTATSTAPTFALSASLKIGRAEEHLKTLGDEIAAWARSSPCGAVKECSPDGTAYTFYVEIKDAPPLDRWALIAGDCAHNLRSALDNLLYALAIRDTGIEPPAKAGKLQMPLASSPEAFEEQKKRYGILTLKDTTQMAIERIQPYNRLHAELPPLLSLVRDFNNLDKHRLLNVVVTNVQQGRIMYEYSGSGQPLVKMGYNSKALQNGSPIAQLIATPPQPNTVCKYEAAIVISIGHDAGPSGRTLGEFAYVMRMLIDEVKSVVAELTA